MLSTQAEAYAASCQEDLKKLIEKLAVIPSPSHHEEQRAAFLEKFLKEKGVPDVRVDRAKNVIWSWNDRGDNDLVVLMSHTDVVFPDTTPLPLVKEEDVWRCPGIVDDTTPLCILLTAALYYFQNGFSPNTGLLIVANSCEEGLGNLKGSRAIVDDYGDRIREFITVESSLCCIANRAVGSHRYRVTVETEGGHSFSRFGNRNAIATLASMIDALYTIHVPKKSDTKTTYNVGLISGGTSVNTIAQKAEMLFEYRSDDLECLQAMKRAFDGVIEAWRAMGVKVGVELIGDRPCSSVDAEKEAALVEKIARSVRDIAGCEPKLISESTDANYPLFKGIPAVCIGSVEPHGCHTREEFLELKDLLPGTRFVLDVLQNYFD